MNVDSDNFSEVRREILQSKLIQKSQMISFDLEFAGIKFDNNERDKPEYLPAEKYQKMSAVARKYTIFQVGITFFHRQGKQIIAYPYNFYVFPRPTLYADPTVSMQSGCVSFNISNNMNWSRWIEKGITYMKLTEYEKVSDIQEKAKPFGELFNFLDEENQAFIKEVIEGVQKGHFDSKSFSLPQSSFHFMRKALQKYFQENQKLYVFKVLKQKQEQNDDLIHFQIRAISQEEKVIYENKKQQELYGFTLLFERIWNSGKSFIGHNAFFDILFLYESFIAPLPFDYHLFKKSIAQVGEKEEQKRLFYDTKFIASWVDEVTNQFDERTSLEDVYKYFLNNKSANTAQVTLAKGFQEYDLKNQILHEAGFDSYLTGWIYYQLEELSSRHEIRFKEFGGKINMNRSYFYIDQLNLGDGIHPFSRVFYIEVSDLKKYVPIDYLKKQKSDTLKCLRELLKKENVAKQVILHEGMKQVFLQIKSQKSFEKVVKILVRSVQEKRIKDLYTISHYVDQKQKKEWHDNMQKLASY